MHVGLINDSDDEESQGQNSHGAESENLDGSQGREAAETHSEYVPMEIHADNSGSVSSSIGSRPAVAVVTKPELRRRKCNSCYFCSMPDDCGTCQSCRLNKTRTRRLKDACLRRVCLEVPEHERRQIASGFPRLKGNKNQWKFSFGKPDRDVASGTHEALRGLSLISPAGIIFKSVEAAQTRCPNQLEGMKLHRFYNQIGVQVLKDISEDPLLGKGFSNEWINMNGERRSIYGTVIKLQHDTADDINEMKYTVRYGNLREDVVDTTGTSLPIPEEDVFTHDRTWGGCLAYEEMMYPDNRTLVASGDAPYCETWLVPRMYNRHMVGTLVEDERVRLPCLKIQHKVFQLTFSVKPSTITNAGYGVFLSCDVWEPTKDNLEHFELPAGQLLDFGIYAPFRPEDRRNDHEFLMKNFVHNYRCSEYSFDTSARGLTDEITDIFDITDDYTGLLHVEAKRHVTPYVNEVLSANDVANVHARYDCEGGLHYMLGHERTDQGPFRLKFGVETELFIDYGHRYEDVRLRQGYPRRPLDESEVRRLLKIDELEYLREVDSYTADEIKSTVQLFSRFPEQKNHELREDVIVRTILVLLLVKGRAKRIYIEFEGVGEDESVCDNGGRDTDGILKESQECTRLINRFVGIWDNTTELHTQLNAEGIYRDGLEMVFTKKQLDCTATEFVNLVCGA
jgi:hypothetical protein